MAFAIGKAIKGSNSSFPSFSTKIFNQRHLQIKKFVLFKYLCVFTVYNVYYYFILYSFFL